MSTPKVIGEGTYGCVHKPSLKCKNKPKINNKTIYFVKTIINNTFQIISDSNSI